MSTNIDNFIHNQRVMIEEYVQCAVYICVGVLRCFNILDMIEFVFFTEGSTIATGAAVSITKKAPLFASCIGKSESESGARAWLSGALALPAAGLNNNYSCHLIAP